MGQPARTASVGCVLRALAELVLPPTCAGCGAPDEPLCAACRSAILEGLWPTGPRVVSPVPRPARLPRTYASGPYAGPLGACITAYKDEGRRDCAGGLAAILGATLDRALADPAVHHVLARGNGPVFVVPVATSRAARRRRGDAPLLGLARLATEGCSPREVVVADALSPRRRVADQAGLSATARAVNLEWSMQVRRRWEATLAGAVCVVVDDVLTTGATLVEAGRALRRAGAQDVVAATICATQRRHRPPGSSSAAGS